MNSILDEITYSDGRMDDVVKSLYTPAKLKLRAKTYEGINRNLNARRNPVMEVPAFSIPNAFMAVEVPSGTEGGADYTVIVANELENAKLDGKQKKLKVSQKQIDGISKSNPSEPLKNVAIVQPVEEITITPEINVVEPVLPVVDEISSFPTVEEKQEVSVQEAELVEDVKPVGEQKEVITPAPVVDPLDAAREKVLNTQPIQSEEVQENEEDVVKQAEDTDVFKQLEKATNEYSRVDEDFKKSVEAYERAQQELEISKNDFEKIEDDIEKTSAKIGERNETIDSTNKEIEDIRIKSEEIDKNIRAKIKLVNSAKEKRMREQKETERNTSKIIDENKTYQEKIETSKKKAQELEVQEKQLELEESKVIEAKQEAMQQLNNKMAILEAITLPEEIALDNSMEEVSSYEEVPVIASNDEIQEDFQYSKRLAA